MKWRKVLFVFLLVSVLTLPAYCGAWGWVRGSSDGYSELSSTAAAVPTTPASGTSQSEEQNDAKAIEKLLKSSEESSAAYDASLESVESALEEVRNSEAKKNVQALVETLKINKAKDDENFAILADTAIKNELALAEAEKKIDNLEKSVHMDIGLSLGYSYPTILAPGIKLQMRANKWIFQTGISYDIDVLKSPGQVLDLDPSNIRTEIAVMYQIF